jgi:hypothetical protein
MTVEARIDDTREPRAYLRVHAPETRIERLSRFFTPLGLHGTGGTAVCDLVASKDLASYDDSWALTGRVKVIHGQFRHTTSGRMIEDLQADVEFLGRKARVDGASFRLDGAQIAFDGYAPSLAISPLHYRAHAAEINLPDLDVGLALPPARLRGVAVEGVIDSEDVILTRASLSSAHGTLLNDVPFRNLKANVTWSGGGLAFSDLRAEALNGTLQGEGRWLARAEHGFDIVAQFDSTDVRPAVSAVLPQMADRLTGKLHLRTRLQGTGNGDGQNHPQAQLRGSGEAAITRGVIKNFNLLTHVFSGGGGSPNPSPADESLPSAAAELAERADTRFETLKSKLVLERQRLRFSDVVLSTPDYTLTGSGSVGFDRSTRWSGSISLSPAATQQLQREFTALRYFIDRRGRLSFPFRADGKLPHVKVRYENRALAQILRVIASPRTSTQGADKKDPRGEP